MGKDVRRIWEKLHEEKNMFQIYCLYFFPINMKKRIKII